MPSSSSSPATHSTSASPQQSRHSSSGKQAKVDSDANIHNFAPVARIMKSALPDNAKIAKEAKECMQECVSEFISFITSEASEKCHQEKRKTVNGEDILFAMASLGFENYGEALKIYLARYRENMIARGEQQRPATSGGGANASSTNANYDGNSHAGLEGSTDSGAQFGYDVTHSTGSDY